MFDSHPELAVPGESYFITELLPRRPTYEREVFDAERFVDDVITLGWTSRRDVPTWIDRWKIDKEVLRQAVTRSSPRTYADAVRSVFRCYADWKGKPLYGDKTPAYIRSIEVIASLLPEARFVHLVRDGRDVALAFQAAPFGPRTIEEIALHWRARTLAGRMSGRRLGPERYMEVRYEDLVARPDEVLTNITEWLGLRFYPEMLDHRDSVKGLKLGFESAHQNVLKPVQTGMRDWRNQMPRDHLERFELVAGDALEEFGYVRSCPSPPLRTRAIVEARRAMLTAKKLSRRARGLSSGEWW
jgi:hypothetical protein